MVNFLDQAENDSKNHLTKQKKEIKYITLLEIVLIIILLRAPLKTYEKRYNRLKIS